MTFTNLPIKDLSLEVARAGGLNLTAAYFAANGVAVANGVTYWVAPEGTYNSAGGTGVANYNPTGTVPNVDLMPVQPAGFAGTYGNGPETAALSPSLTALHKPRGPLFLFLYNTGGANTITLRPLAGTSVAASQKDKVALDVSTVNPATAGALSVLGPFSSAELAQLDGTYQFSCTATAPSGFIIAFRVDFRA
jgi:hypothetical protein